MFSGIIEKCARVSFVAPSGGSLVIELESGWSDLSLGESIAVNGVCLTVTHFDASGLARFFISPETLSRTNLGALAAGQYANLERAVTLDTRLSGHLVQGHVDGLARLVERVESDGAWRHVFLLPETLGRYCVEKGSIALNGIRYREVEPWALVRDRSTQAEQAAQTLEQIRLILEQRQSRIPQGAKKLAIVSELIDLLSGRGGDPNILRQIEELKEDDAE